MTGAARGIGFETARQLHLRGASVAVVDLDAEQAREAAERIGPRAIGIAADVTDQAAMHARPSPRPSSASADSTSPSPTRASPSRRWRPRAGSGTEEWERVFEVDLLGVWRTVRAALPQIVERRGQIVVISSVYAFVNGMLNSPYAVAKAGVESLGRALRVELTPHRRQRQRRLLRLGRHEDGPGRLRAPDADRMQEIHSRLPAEAAHARRGGGGARPRDRRAGAAGLRAALVALRLRPARRAQPAARPPPGEGRRRCGAAPRPRGESRRRRRRDFNSAG